MFESFEYLDRGWDVRALEQMSLRSIFLYLLVMVFLLGGGFALSAYQIVRLHRFSWSFLLDFAVVGFLAVRYARLVYRKLKS